MVEQMLARRMTGENEGMAVMADFALPPVLRDMPFRRIALGVATVNFLRRGHDLVLQVGPRLHGGRDVRHRLVLIHAYQDGRNRIEKLLRLRLFYGFGSAGHNRLVDFLGRRSQEPSRNEDKGKSDQTNEKGSKPNPGSVGFHRFGFESCAIIGADPL